MEENNTSRALIDPEEVSTVKLRELIEARERLETFRAWAKKQAHAEKEAFNDLRVEWRWGGAIGDFSLAQAAISEVVREQLPYLISLAEANLAKRVTRRVRAVAEP